MNNDKKIKNVFRIEGTVGRKPTQGVALRQNKMAAVKTDAVAATAFFFQNKMHRKIIIYL